LILAAVLALGAALPGDGPARPNVWGVTIVRVTTPATGALPSGTAPSIQGRVIEPLQVEERAEALESAYLFDVRIRNVSRSVQTLHWDVSGSVRLVLPGRRTVLPIGQKIHGLSENSVVAKGVLEVDIPPQATYRLYPVFALARFPRGATLIIDGVGHAHLTR
jgi:hypothetical protein